MSDYRFEAEHIFAKGLWDDPMVKAFLDLNLYTKNMVGNQIALFSDPQLVRQLQNLPANSPLRQALLDQASTRGINRHQGNAETGNQFGKNKFLNPIQSQSSQTFSKAHARVHRPIGERLRHGQKFLPMVHLLDRMRLALKRL